MTSSNLTIYFVRHGKTEWNLTGQMQGWGDSPLVEEGISGAKAVGTALRDVDFEAVYTSPSKRTQDTARLILDDEGSELHLLEELREMHFGSWEGVRVAELDAQFPEERHEFMTSPATFDACVNGGETYYQLEERVLAGVRKIVQAHAEGNILVVSHGMTLTLLMHLLNGGTVEEHREKGTRILNTSISVVRYEDEAFRVLKVNETEHLTQAVR
ncbi:histidine phosphatase family protein [Listeria costaricensis]|uniref:histidine phosphatase family protein n=1 Tax=Listeria costaricensis TaxID=2026604 RepID=UPI000C0820BC|nr:histidine phosphatase family protein [Listeria costaricensis]